MGWCSGTRIFDAVVGPILGDTELDDDPDGLIKFLIKELWDMDWDCEWDSKYIHNPRIRAIFEELDPEMFSEDL